MQIAHYSSCQWFKLKPSYAEKGWSYSHYGQSSQMTMNSLMQYIEIFQDSMLSTYTKYYIKVLILHSLHQYL